jgi:transglutaminase-like putative cysteine protease
MTEDVSYAPRPLSGQVAAMTLLIAMAWLPLSGDLALQISAYVAFLITLRLASLRWPALAPGRWFLLPLTLAGMALVFSVYHTFAGQNGGTALLGTMLALKLLELHRLRDVRVAAILFGFLLVSQFLFDQSPLRGLYLVALLVLDVALLVDLAGRTRQGRPALISALRIAARLCVQALPLALVLFVFFPRLNAPLWSLGHTQDRAVSGIKNWLEPGSISELVIDGEPAFRVRFDGPIPAESMRYWRGPIAWHTDGRRWTGWPSGEPREKTQELVEAGGEIGYQVELQPSGERWLFALDMPVQAPEDAKILPDFQVVATKPTGDTRSYRAISALRYHTGELDLAQEAAGTQLPDNVTPRMRALVAGWRGDSRSSTEVVGRALRFFREEPFHYTLLPPKLGPNPADEFLFETRRGFCEHYASSFALLMRIAGIPSRIVLGYLGGEYNALGGYLIVRQSDAHAWTEVWMEGKGWMRVDPTAAVAPERVERSDLLEGLASGAPTRFRLDGIGALRSWIHNLRLLGDAMGTSWREWVLGLSSARQQRMMEIVGLGHLREFGLAIALIVSASVVLSLLLAAMTRTAAPQDPLERIYAAFCKRLCRIGLPRRASEGPLDFSRRVVAARPDLRIPVESFISLYIPQRYGSSGGAHERKQLEQQLRRFRPRRHQEQSEQELPGPFR